MKQKNPIWRRKLILLPITASILILVLIWIKFKPLKGQIEEFIPVSEKMTIRFFNLQPILNLSGNEQQPLSELQIEGAWIKMITPVNRLYFLRIMPQCEFLSYKYFYVKTDDKPDITRKPNEFVSQTVRDGINYNMYLQYEDITYAPDYDRIYPVSPMKYSVTGNRISKKSLLNNGKLSEREKLVIFNLPSGARIIDVYKLHDLEAANSEKSLWDYLYKIIPWLLLFILLLILLLNWKRIKNFYKRKIMIHKENLQEFGYISSGKSGGDPVQFRSYLNGIYNGDITDSSNTGLTENQIANIKSKIKVLDKNIENNNSKVQEFNEGENLPIFDPIRFIISIIIFTGLTIFSYFFYLSTINKALFLKFTDINCEEASKLSVLPSQDELIQAIDNSLFILVVPFTVFALGWILHLVLDNHRLRTGQRILFLGALLLITFILDFLLATYIHKNLNAIKVYCGYGTNEVWYLSTTFYIIIFMGFLVYIFWSLIMNNILQQVEKRNRKRVIQNNIEKIKLDTEYLKRRKDKQINLLENRIGNIEGSIDLFYQGWNMFMNNFPDRFAEYKRKCEEIRNEFVEKIYQHHE